MGFADDFDAILEDLPDDWSFFETFVMLDDASHLAEARVALGRANARPVKGPGRVDFEITVAHSWGRGAAPGVVRSGLRILDGLGIGGHIFAGDARAAAMPAPAHRYGPQLPLRGMYRDEDDLELLAELAGVLDATVSKAGLSAATYLVLREITAEEGPHAITALAERMSAQPDEVADAAGRLVSAGLAETRPNGLVATRKGGARAETVETSANEAMRAHVLERPHSATIYGLVAAMQSGRFTVEDLIEFLAEGPDGSEE